MKFTSQRLSEEFLLPIKINFAFLYKCIACLSNTVTQSSLQSWPMDRSELLFINCGNMRTVLEEVFVLIGSTPWEEDLIIYLSGNVAKALLLFVIFPKTFLSTFLT